MSGPETGEIDGRLATDSGQVRGCDVKSRKLKRGKIGITSHIELNTPQSKSGNSYLKVLVPTFHIFFRKRSPTKKIRPRSLSWPIQERRNRLLSAVICSQETLWILQARLTWTLDSKYDPHLSSLWSWIDLWKNQTSQRFHLQNKWIQEITYNTALTYCSFYILHCWNTFALHDSTSLLGSVLSASCSIDSDVTSNSWSTCTLRSASCCAHPFFLEHSLWACLSWPFRLMSSVEGSAKVSCYTQTLTSDSCVQDSPAPGSNLATNYHIMLECQCFHISRRCSKSRFFSNSTSQRDSTLPLMRLISGSNKSQTSQQQLQNGPEMNIWDQQKFAI